MSCIFVQIPHCFRRYGKLHEVVFKWVTTEGAARCAVRGSVVRAEKPRNIFSEAGRLSGTCLGIDLFFPHIYSHPKMMPNKSCNFATSDLGRPTGDASPEAAFSFALASSSVPCWLDVTVVLSASAEPHFYRLLYDIQKHRKTLPLNATTPQKMKAIFKVYDEAHHCLSIIPDH